MHGGVVKTFKDLELFESSNCMPKLFPESSLSTGSDKVWRNVVLAEQNNGDDGRASHDHKFYWADLQLSLIPTSLIQL